ncbi:MAG TPA: hypothetical protein VNP04_13380 [Alphaproteobacteria bacterium]|nr:hypothetical protein [Alphaproteobacteria bacterium]
MPQTPTIFVVCEDSGILEEVTSTLRNDGYRVRAVSDGRRALALLLRDPPSW